MTWTWRTIAAGAAAVVAAGSGIQASAAATTSSAAQDLAAGHSVTARVFAAGALGAGRSAAAQTFAGPGLAGHSVAARTFAGRGLGAESAAAQTVAPYSVVSIPAPPVNAAVPPDGRLRGDGFTAEVLGVATGTDLGTGSGAVAAGAGQRLWVFGLSFDVDENNDGSAVVHPSATLIAEGTRTAIPVDTSDNGLAANNGSTGPTWWAASVPAGAPDVDVEAAAGGYAQDFSLPRMARVGQTPAVLYRDPTSWQISQPFSLTKTIAAPNPDTTISFDAVDLTKASVTVNVTGATLSWFGPTDPTDTPADPTKAWLTIQATSTGSTNGGIDTCAPDCGIDFQTGLSAAQVTLTPPGAAPIPATIVDAGAGEAPTGIFQGTYAFQVPADLTAAALKVAPGSLQVVQPDQVGIGGFTPTSYTLTPAAPAIFDLTLPALAAYTPPPGATARPATYTAGRSTSAGARRSATGGTTTSSGGGAWPIPLVAGLAVIAAAAVLVARRRRVASASVAAGVAQSPPSPPQPPWSAAATAPAPVTPPATARPADGVDHHVDGDVDSDVDRPGQTTPALVNTPPSPPQSGSGPAPAAPAGSPTDTATAPSTAPAAASDPLAANTASAGSNVADKTPFVAPVPDLGDCLVVRVLGPVEVTGWANPPKGGIITAVLVYLACHPERPTSVEVLRARLGAGRNSDPDVRTVHTYISRLRSAIGAGRVTDAGAHGGYQAEDVPCDLVQLRAALAATATAHATGAGNATDGADPSEAIEVLSAALAWVRGVPFADVGDRDGFGWVDHENLRDSAEADITTAAGRLARLALDTGQRDLAAWAAHQGLLANPTSTTLADLVLSAAADDTDRLATEWRATRRRYKANRQVVPDQLARRYPRRATTTEAWSHVSISTATTKDHHPLNKRAG